MTERQIQVLELAARGYAQKQMAARLHVSTYTIKTHTVQIFAALRAKNMTHAVAIWVGGDKYRSE